MLQFACVRCCIDRRTNCRTCEYNVFFTSCGTYANILIWHSSWFFAYLVAKSLVRPVMGDPNLVSKLMKSNLTLMFSLWQWLALVLWFRLILARYHRCSTSYMYNTLLFFLFYFFLFVGKNSENINARAGPRQMSRVALIAALIDRINIVH